MTSGKKWVVLTGATRGIGRACAERLAADGFGLHLVARDSHLLSRLAKQLPTSCSVFACDLTDISEIERIFVGIQKPIYGIVNNAGRWEAQNLGERSVYLTRSLMELNLFAVEALTAILLPNIEPNGRIINISSQLGLYGRAGMGSYTATKHALVGITKCWALELAERQITVNAVCPGWVKTDSNLYEFTAEQHITGISAAQRLTDISKTLPLKRFIEPKEVASFVAFLLSPEASGVTGQAHALI